MKPQLSVTIPSATQEKSRVISSVLLLLLAPANFSRSFTRPIDRRSPHRGLQVLSDLALLKTGVFGLAFILVALPWMPSGLAKAETVTALATTEVRLSNASGTDRNSGIHGGVFGDTFRRFMSIRGSNSRRGLLQAFAVFDFQFGQPQTPVSDVDTLTLSLVEEHRYWTEDGEFDFYWLRNRSEQLTDASLNLDGTPSFQLDQNGIDAIDPVFSPSSDALAKVSFTSGLNNHTPWNVELKFRGDNQSELLNAINNGERIRIGISASESTPNAGAQFLGSDAQQSQLLPRLSYGVTAIPEPSGMLVLVVGGCWIATHRRRRLVRKSAAGFRVIANDLAEVPNDWK